MRKLLASFLALTLMLCLFGCGGATNDEEQGGNQMEEIVETKYPTDQYDLDAYMAPYWQGDTMYQESVMVLENEDGTVSDIPLLYKAKAIASVRTSDLKTLFKAGVDYELADGKLRILPGSAIPTVAYTDYYPTTETEKCMQLNEAYGPGYIFYDEGATMHQMQIAVSYIHEDTFAGETPAYNGDNLPKTMAKLENGAAVKIAIYGDSISTGLNSSGIVGAEPNAEPWFAMFVKRLQKKYPNAQISYYNPSRSGQKSTWGAEQAATLLEDGTDLCIIAFGMNDGTIRNPALLFKSNIQTIMNVASGKNSDCEFVLISTMLPNPESGNFYGIQKDYLPELLSMETEGVVVADVTSFHESLLVNKRYFDMSGNNVNHPNDFLARVYGQVVYQTVAGY